MPCRGSRGFTLVELMIVITIIGLIAAISLPNLVAARLAANETSAIATLRNILSAQAHFQESARADTDSDGAGEHGGFLEMSGTVAGRMAALLSPPVLSGAFRSLNANGEVNRSGYFYRAFLPGPGGAGVAEPVGGFTAAMVDADRAEIMWCVYAHPVNSGHTGVRTFFINQSGSLTTTEFPGYNGTGAGPAADAAFQTLPGTIAGNVAIGVAGNDTRVWRQVN